LDGLKPLRKRALLSYRLSDYGDISMDAESCRYIVIDEADKLLALGMKEQLDRLKALLLPSGSAAGSSHDNKRPQVRALWLTIAEHAGHGMAQRRHPLVIQLFQVTLRDV
jgi:hypothetical protein